MVAVDGIHNVITALGEVEKGRLRDVDYLEAQACVGGCVGGPLVPENPYVTRANIKAMADVVQDRPLPYSAVALGALYGAGAFFRESPIAAAGAETRRRRGPGHAQGRAAGEDR